MKLRWVLIALLGTALLPVAAMAQSSGSPEFGPGDPLQDPHQSIHPWDIDRSPDIDLDHDAYFQALQEGPLFSGRGQGYRTGFRAGYEDGRMDLEDGQRWHFGYRFRHPDHYRVDFDDRYDNLREYREGYEQGYRHAYAQQS